MDAVFTGTQLKVVLIAHGHNFTSTHLEVVLSTHGRSFTGTHLEEVLSTHGRSFTDTHLEVVLSTHGRSFPEKPRFPDDLVGERHPAPDCTVVHLSRNKAARYYLLRHIHTERKRKRNFPLIFFVFSLIFIGFVSAFARCERVLNMDN